MFEQFKESLKLTGETSVIAREGFGSALKHFKSMPRFTQGMWICIVGAIVVPTIASYFSIAWYNQLFLVLGIVVLPLWIWVESATVRSKAERIDDLMRSCIWYGVLIGIAQVAGGHYFRALMAVVAIFIVVPWLGKKWINRSDR